MPRASVYVLVWAAGMFTVGCGPVALDKALVAGESDQDEGTETEDASVNAALVTDEGLTSGYQDSWWTGFKRGRGNTVADFDGDGDYDVFSSNPGDESFLIENVTPPGGPLTFVSWQKLGHDELFFGSTAADFDNDGDIDLFISGGGNDGFVPDRFFRNDLSEGAPHSAPFVDISDQMELIPRTPTGADLPNGAMGAIALDADLDGLLDIWVSNVLSSRSLVGELEPWEVLGLNQLHMNQGDLKFEDRALEHGLDQQLGSRNSAVLDFDNDGDYDLLENNYFGPNILWKNTLDEDRLLFENITDEAGLHGELALPVDAQGMSAIAVDLDNDGWDDLVFFVRSAGPLADIPIEGHRLWMNVGGQGFVDVTDESNLNDEWVWWDHEDDEKYGVMGCQVGDVDLDGFPDLYIGNGGGYGGEVDQLFVQRERIAVDIAGAGLVNVPQFDNWSAHIDFPPPHHDQRHVETGTSPEYPLRTHGITFADFDRDGIDEIAVHNGGPAFLDDVGEPNRLFKFHLEDPRFLRMRISGDGELVNADGIGTKVRVQVERDSDGATWDLYKTRRSHNGFSAQNSPELVFGLGDADRVTEIEITWPDGLIEWVDPPTGQKSWLVIRHP